VTIGKTATTSDWRELRGSACVVPALRCIRPHLQAEPFDAAPCRAFFRAPLAPGPVPECQRSAFHQGLFDFPLMKVWQPVQSLASGWWSAMSVWHSMQDSRSARTFELCTLWQEAQSE